MNILFLVHRIPYPPDKGDKIRSYNVVRYLSQNHDIYLGTILDGGNIDISLSNFKRRLKDICAVKQKGKLRLIKSVFTRAPFSVSNFYDEELQDYVDRILETKKIDTVICFCSSMAEYIFQTPMYKKDKLNGIKLIIDYVDLDSDKWRQYAEYSNGLLRYIYSLESRRLFKYELEINRKFHHSVFVSKREEDTFIKLSPNIRNITIVPNGVNYDYFTPRPEKNFLSPFYETNGPKIIFTGVMDYFANEDGVSWFCNEIYPIIKKELPRAEFYIVGNRPTDMVWSLSEIDGVTVTGYVQDIRVYYWTADLCVTPLRIARGLQNKVIEAMATGNAVVATPNASNGIHCTDNEDILIADNAEAFASKVISLLRNDAKRESLGKNAVKTIRQHYLWEKNLKALDEMISEPACQPDYNDAYEQK
jgi:sugar transferase (PEP-CTERM/EpsH1 system associated)